MSTLSDMCVSARASNSSVQSLSIPREDPSFPFSTGKHGVKTERFTLDHSAALSALRTMTLTGQQWVNRALASDVNYSRIPHGPQRDQPELPVFPQSTCIQLMNHETNNVNGIFLLTK